ncbi:hypothetical protein DFS33DRAFT_637992 [Desarmillaria ectypa]|nr:hypothetical protein DFS33DRAFT_637992 [Desarmillaria ectypa]
MAMPCRIRCSTFRRQYTHLTCALNSKHIMDVMLLLGRSSFTRILCTLPWMKRRNAGEDKISRKSARSSETTTKPKASKAPKAQTECMTVWRHAGRRSASRAREQRDVQPHTFDWDSQAGTNSTSLEPVIVRSNTSQDLGHLRPPGFDEKLFPINLDGFDSGMDSIQSDHFALGPGYGQQNIPLHHMSRDARSSYDGSWNSRSEIYSTMMSDRMDGPDTNTPSPLPHVTSPLQRPRQITLHGSSSSSPLYNGQNPVSELNNYSDPWIPHGRPLQRRRCITLHGDSTSAFSDDSSWHAQPFRYLPNNADYSNMPVPPSLSAESFFPVPSVSAFSPGSEYSASDTSFLSPPSTMLFPSIPQTSLVNIYDPTSSFLRPYPSHGSSPTTEMRQYCESSTSLNQSMSRDNPWGMQAGSLSVLSNPPTPSFANPSEFATGPRTRHSAECDQSFLHDPRNTYPPGFNQVNHDISPYAESPFSSSSYMSENYTPYQPLLDYNPMPQTASSLHYSPGLQNALQLEFGTATLDLLNTDVSETGPLDPELLLMDFHAPQNNEQ